MKSGFVRQLRSPDPTSRSYVTGSESLSSLAKSQNPSASLEKRSGATQRVAVAVMQKGDASLAHPPLPPSNEVTTAPKRLLPAIPWGEHAFTDPRGRAHSIYLVKDADQLAEIVTWKSGFSIYEAEPGGQKIIVLTRWINRERGSSHHVIEQGMADLLGARPGRCGGPAGVTRIAAGYVRRCGEGGFLIEDLPGSYMYQQSLLRRSQLSDEALRVKAAFRTELGVSVLFPTPEEYEAYVQDMVNRPFGR